MGSTSSTQDPGTTKMVVEECLAEVTEVMDRQRDEKVYPIADFNKDEVFRSLVTEMLNAKKYALIKMELLACNSFNEFVSIDMPLQMCFRDHMGDLARRLKATPSSELALRLCKLHGLLVGSVTEVNDLGETPLMTAIADGITDDKLELLLEAGSDVNFTMDYSGELYKRMTPILLASVYGRTSTISVLAARGADVRAVDGEEQSCVYHAARNGHASAVEVLVGLNADVNRPDRFGWTPMYTAARQGNVSCIEMLARLGVDINALCLGGASSPMHRATEEAHVSAVQTLLRLGADTTIICQGYTAMDLAIQLKLTAVVGAFKAAGVTSVRFPNV